MAQAAKVGYAKSFFSTSDVPVEYSPLSMLVTFLALPYSTDYLPIIFRHKGHYHQPMLDEGCEHNKGKTFVNHYSSFVMEMLLCREVPNKATRGEQAGRHVQLMSHFL